MSGEYLNILSFIYGDRANAANAELLARNKGFAKYQSVLYLLNEV